jgi:hypothetical protein
MALPFNQWFPKVAGALPAPSSSREIPHLHRHNVGASVGWAAGERFGMMTAFIVSGVGSAIGVYAGWWAARRWL